LQGKLASLASVQATTASRAVYSLDLATGTATKTAATGDMIAVDPVAGNAVYTGVRPVPGEDNFVIKTDGNGSFKIIWDTWGNRGAILKYTVAGDDLTFAARSSSARMALIWTCSSLTTLVVPQASRASSHMTSVDSLVACRVRLLPSCSKGPR
jgi:hypothetical protein